MTALFDLSSVVNSAEYRFNSLTDEEPLLIEILFSNVVDPITTAACPALVFDVLDGGADPAVFTLTDQLPSPDKLLTVFTDD